MQNKNAYKKSQKYLKAIVCGENVVVTQRDRDRRVSKMITHIECRARKQHHDQRKRKVTISKSHVQK